MKRLEGVKGKHLFLIWVLLTFTWNSRPKLFIFLSLQSLPLYVPALIPSNASVLTPYYPNHLQPSALLSQLWYCMSFPPSHGATSLCSLSCDNSRFSIPDTILRYWIGTATPFQLWNNCSFQDSPKKADNSDLLLSFHHLYHPNSSPEIFHLSKFWEQISNAR